MGSSSMLLPREVPAAYAPPTGADAPASSLRCSRRVYLDHPSPITRAVAWTGRIQGPVALDGDCLKRFEPGGVDPHLVFQDPSEPLRGRSIELEGVADDALQLELRAANREGVQDFRQTAAVLRGGQTVEEGPLGICHLDACFADPHLVYSEESVGLGLDELEARPCDRISTVSPTMTPAACPWHRPGRREYEHLPRDLLGQPV